MVDDWRELLEWATPEERRTLVESEHAAALYFTSLRAAGVPMAGAFVTPAALDVLAQVCVAVHGTVGELMEGRAIA